MSQKGYILVFVHIKKTAGIALQLALAKQYGDKFYGGYTHGALKGCAVNPLERGDLDKVPLGSCVCKHWGYDVFSSIARKCKFLTVVRDPRKRIVSHYNFMLKHHPNGPSFRKYIRNPENVNVMSRMIVDPVYFDEILIVEHLDEDLPHSQLVQANRLKRANRTPYRYTPQAEELEEFDSLNDADLQLYADLLLKRKNSKTKM